ncbi:PREDICTED: uncharacterized protein LOC108662786 [Theobroma cacao]|uniref:Uncharacterized protein LOC108662786 n=1 Tax=Theobroma cacao TaxID=3641 RepID=A0AB32WME3_THECC|nr:PREDICTED: uncharacterized protein LOC108662786 [Theobroma cacao]
MAFSNENVTLEDNIATLEADTVTLENITASDERNKDWFPTSEDRFDDNSDDGPDEWHDESSDEDRLYDSDIPICNNVEGETEPVGGVDGCYTFTVAIDATHLKGRFKGILFVAVCKDVNECVCPIAFGIGHVEDENSWMWFLSKLRDAVGCLENTMFIFDQHLNIKKVIQNAYPEAHHGLCEYHLKKNFKNKFKRDDVSMIFTLARDCYKVFDFNRHINQLKQIHVRVHADLMRIGPKRWARACSPARRYQMMTSNIVERVNSCLKHARQMSITVLIEFIRDMFQRWFHDRYEEAVKVTTPLSPWVARQLSKWFNDAHRFVVKLINQVEFKVKDKKMDGLVNLSTKTCSCCEFQIDLLPCSHAIVAIRSEYLYFLFEP